MSFVCRDHHDRPVKANGRGCPELEHRGRRITGGQRHPTPEQSAIAAVLARWDRRNRNPKITD